MDFEKEFENTRRLVEAELEKYMNFAVMPQKKVLDAMAYSLMAGGKRLRPVIMIMAARMCGADEKTVMPFACAVEMIHTYSLIHDDLPAMDNDDLRRGKPTNHKKFGEAAAILAGDALLNMAFEITSEYSCEGVSDRQVLCAVSALSKAAGAMGMIGGQMIDIESENKELSLDELKNLHALKTGALIRASGVCAAVLAGADEAEIKAVDEYCLNLGIAFQIRDDILDVAGDTKTLGKPVGSDKENNKNTFVSLTSLKEAQRLVAEYTKKAADALLMFEDRAECLLGLAKWLSGREY